MTGTPNPSPDRREAQKLFEAVKAHIMPTLSDWDSQGPEWQECYARAADQIIAMQAPAVGGEAASDVLFSAYEQGYEDGFVDQAFPEGDCPDPTKFCQAIDRVAVGEGFGAIDDVLKAKLAALPSTAVGGGQEAGAPDAWMVEPPPPYQRFLTFNMSLNDKEDWLSKGWKITGLRTAADSPGSETISEARLLSTVLKSRGKNNSHYDIVRAGFLLEALAQPTPPSLGEENQEVRSAREPALAASGRNAGAFQARVGGWMAQCFPPEVSEDLVERCDRFTEEALELVQAVGYSPERAHALVDYVFGRDVGDPPQEVGGVQVTLAALCNTAGLDMADAGEVELARILRPEIILKIRAKQAAKPTGSALPVATSCAADASQVPGIDQIPPPQGTTPVLSVEGGWLREDVVKRIQTRLDAYENEDSPLIATFGQEIAMAADLRTMLATLSNPPSTPVLSDRVAELEAALKRIRDMKPSPIPNTGFETGPAVHFSACRRIARAALTGGV